jgi:hypothetical protein
MKTLHSFRPLWPVFWFVPAALVAGLVGAHFLAGWLILLGGSAAFGFSILWRLRRGGNSAPLYLSILILIIYMAFVRYASSLP